MPHIVKIISIKKITHDVLEIRTEKPGGYTFVPGQATEIAINQPEWIKEKRPFTFTCLPKNDYLEFVIKTYPNHEGVTAQLLTLKADDELVLDDSWGDIHYKKEGVFIAGGAGITPFISIFRDLADRNQLANNKLLFANKTKADIILKDELTGLLNSNFVNVLSNDESPGFKHGYIDKDLLMDCKLDSTKYFYLCGPEPMMEALEKHLIALGVKPAFVVKEGF